MVTTCGGGVATVLCVVKTVMPVANPQTMVSLPGGLVITPHHPIRLDGRWVFPKDVEAAGEVECTEHYTFVLEVGHTVMISGTECVTLGHAFTDNVVRHAFFGSQRVVEDLKGCSGWEEGLVVLTGTAPSPFLVISAFFP